MVIEKINNDKRKYLFKLSRYGKPLILTKCMIGPGFTNVQTVKSFDR